MFEPTQKWDFIGFCKHDIGQGAVLKNAIFLDVTVAVASYCQHCS
jgi:hypothetical protein